MTVFPVYVFDAYGTLFDVHSAVDRLREEIGPRAERLTELWRAKQLEYTWVRSLMGRYRDFAMLTAAALDHAAERCGGIDEAIRDRLLDGYGSLACFADVAPALAGLKAEGARLAILSNGTVPMLMQLVEAAGLDSAFDAILSADSVGAFKTDTRVYALVGDHFAVREHDVGFVSSNRWDIAGARACGFGTLWLNRSGAPDEYEDLPPSATIRSLAELLP